MKYPRFLANLFFTGVFLFYPFTGFTDNLKFTLSTDGKLLGSIQKTKEAMIVEGGVSAKHAHFGWTTLENLRKHKATVCAPIKPKHPPGTVVTPDGKKIIYIHSYYFYINRHIESIGEIYSSDVLQRSSEWSILLFEALSEGLASLPVFIQVFSKHLPIEEDPSEQDLELTHESVLPKHFGETVYLVDPVLDISLDASCRRFPYFKLGGTVTIRCLNWLHEDKCMKAYTIPQCSLDMDSNQATNRISFINHDGRSRSILHLTILFPSVSEETKKTLPPKELKARLPEKVYAQVDTHGKKIHLVYERISGDLDIGLIRKAAVRTSVLDVL